MKLNTEIVWVPVSKRMPDDEMLVLVATESQDIYLASHEENQWFWQNGERVVFEQVTHWADLPLHPLEIPQAQTDLLADRVGAPVVGDKFIKGGSTATVKRVSSDSVILEFQDSSENDRTQNFKLDEFVKCAMRTISQGGVFQPAKN